MFFSPAIIASATRLNTEVFERPHAGSKLTATIDDNWCPTPPPPPIPHGLDALLHNITHLETLGEASAPTGGGSQSVRMDADDIPLCPPPPRPWSESLSEIGSIAINSGVARQLGLQERGIIIIGG